MHQTTFCLCYAITIFRTFLCKYHAHILNLNTRRTTFYQIDTPRRTVNENDLKLYMLDMFL